MTNITESPIYETVIYELATTDPLLGGPAGFSGGNPVTGYMNASPQQLANRTAYLKEHIDDLENGTLIPPGVAPLNNPAFTGTVTGVTKAMIGLGSVDNTSDTLKPISGPAQTALNVKADIASPTFTGVPSAPTPAVGTNTTQLATSAMFQAEIANKRAWTAYTPTLTSVSGTFTTISATGKHMVAFGVCHFQVVITVTTKGTGVRPIFTLPFPALTGSQGIPLIAREGALTGKLGVARITTGLLTGETADYTGTGDLATADGAVLYINGTYPVA